MHIGATERCTCGDAALGCPLARSSTSLPQKCLLERSGASEVQPRAVEEPQPFPTMRPAGERLWPHDKLSCCAVRPPHVKCFPILGRTPGNQHLSWRTATMSRVASAAFLLFYCCFPASASSAPPLHQQMDFLRAVRRLLDNRAGLAHRTATPQQSRVERPNRHPGSAHGRGCGDRIAPSHHKIRRRCLPRSL